MAKLELSPNALDYEPPGPNCTQAGADPLAARFEVQVLGEELSGLISERLLRFRVLQLWDVAKYAKPVCQLAAIARRASRDIGVHFNLLSSPFMIPSMLTRKNSTKSSAIICLIDLAPDNCHVGIRPLSSIRTTSS